MWKEFWRAHDAIANAKTIPEQIFTFQNMILLVEFGVWVAVSPTAAAVAHCHAFQKMREIKQFVSKYYFSVVAGINFCFQEQ